MIKERVKKVVYELEVICDVCLKIMVVVDKYSEINGVIPVGTIRSGNRFVCPKCREGESNGYKKISC